MFLGGEQKLTNPQKNRHRRNMQNTTKSKPLANNKHIFYDSCEIAAIMTSTVLVT